MGSETDSTMKFLEAMNALYGGTKKASAGHSAPWADAVKPDTSTSIAGTMPGKIEVTNKMGGFQKGVGIANLGLGAFNTYMNWDALKLAKKSQKEQKNQFWQQYNDQKNLTLDSLAGREQRYAAAAGQDASRDTAWQKAKQILG